MDFRSAFMGLWRTVGLLLVAAVGVFGEQGGDRVVSSRGSAEVGEPPAVAARLVGEARELGSYFYGYNVNLTVGGLSWHEPRLVEAVRRLVPGNLRYPGGTLANYWDWRAGWTAKRPAVFQQPGRERPMPNRLEDFKVAIDGTGAEPIYVLNMLTSDIEEQLAMLRHARDLGLPIRFVELGNEYYLSDKKYMERYPTAEAYGSEASRWIERIKGEFPKVKIAAVGAQGIYRQDDRRATWNRGVLKTLRGADAITIHVYMGSGLKKLMNQRAAGQKRVSDAEDQPDAWYASPEVQERELEVLKTQEGAEFFLSMSFRAVAQLEQEMGELGELPVWVTEYNLFDRFGPVKGSWAHGLFTATMLGLFLDQPRVELTCCHVIGSPLTSFSTIFMNENPFEKSIVPRKVRPYTPTATGITLGTFGRIMGGMGSVRRMAFDPDLRSGISSDSPYCTLMGWRFADPPRQRAIILNLSHQEIRLDIRALDLKGCTYEQTSAGPGDCIAGSDGVRRWQGEVAEQVILAPYSITAIRERQADSGQP